MQDQVYGLREIGIECALLSSETTRKESQEIYSSMMKPGSKIIYVTPEKISKSKMLMSKLEKTHALGLLSRLVIDEAHCCSTWGHDFRPDYRQLGVLKRQFSDVPVIAVTATASKTVAGDVKKILQLKSCVTFSGSFDRSGPPS